MRRAYLAILAAFALFPAIIPAATFDAVVVFARPDCSFLFVARPNGQHWHVGIPKASPGETDAPEFKRGDTIRVTGRVEYSIKHRIDASKIEKTEAAIPLPPPEETTIEAIFAEVLPYGQTEWYGRMFAVEGMLRDINRRQSTTQLLVGENEKNLQVEIPLDISENLPPNFVLGATVRVTGSLAYTSIENADEGKFGRAENIELIPLDVSGVEVVKKAPFWTLKIIATLCAWLIFLLAIVFAWAITLRRMVAKRTLELGESIRLRQRVRIEAEAARRERLRLAADLHDSFQQYLAGAMFRLRAAINYLPEDAADSRVQLEKVRDALQHTQSGLRSTLWAMNEESVGPESLMELFRFVARRMAHWEGRVSIDSKGEERDIARTFAGTLLLILQEGVGNALKHGAAAHVNVVVEFLEKSLKLVISDDGCGFDASASAPEGHFGIAGMRRRAADLGGEMEISSSPGCGTCLTFVFPL